MKDERPLNNSDYLQETIKARPLNKKRLFKRALEVVAFAILFGLIAYITMSMASRSLTEKLFPQPIDEVTFSDEGNDMIKEEIEPEDMLLQDGTNAMSGGQENLLQISSYLSEVSKASASWLVQVTSVTQETSWLDSTAISENTSAGAIIADNGMELLVVTRHKSLDSAHEIEVTFADGAKVPATIKGDDKNLGITIVAVVKADIPKTTLQNSAAVQMGNSNNKSLLGNPIIALGSPNGVWGSVCHGYLTALNVDINGWDYNYHLVMTDIYGTTNPNGFLVNTKGQLVGILCNTYNSEDTKNLVSAIGISEIKKRIEKISNGNEIPLLGVRGIEVSEEAHSKQGIPNGAYITGVKLDSPAMNAGLQPGDILVKLGEKDVASMYYLSYLLLQKEPAEDIEIVIMRKSQGEYKERVLKLTLANQ